MFASLLSTCLPSKLFSFFFSPGSHYRENYTTPVQETINVIRVIYHSRFSYKTLKNDVALLKLERSITPSDKVNTVCLPESRRDQISPGTNCFITGKVVVFCLYCLIICFDFE